MDGDVAGTRGTGLTHDAASGTTTARLEEQRPRLRDRLPSGHLPGGLLGIRILRIFYFLAHCKHLPGVPARFSLAPVTGTGKSPKQNDPADTDLW